ncbi:MAG: hypothetical protein PHX25_03430, partial [Candidatus Pacebacteria bacterium]|nr:hypothetical protein [Candidatus Paceibacterota bacterium]
PQKNRAKPEKQKGKKEGGLGEGIFALLRLRIERFRFSLNKRNIRQYGGQAPQKNFLFLLKEKIAREKIKKCRENFSVLVCRSGAEASGNAPHSCSGFSLKKVRISFRIRSKIKKDILSECLFLFLFPREQGIFIPCVRTRKAQAYCCDPQGATKPSRGREHLIDFE